MIIIVLLYSFDSIACGALNGKGYQCILFKKKYDQKNYYTIGDKIFFIFNKKEIHEPFLNKDTSPIKISTYNHGFYSLNVENIEWNEGKYILILHPLSFDKIQLCLKKKYTRFPNQLNLMP